MSDRDTFGLRLRAERERRGISLDTLACVTNVSAELWEGLERNDFSRWPSGIFARSFIRDYARAIGLDETAVVDEFCRLFPIGDRRAKRIIEEQARIIGHEPHLLEANVIPAVV
jgi:cytoskeletal protein RodZ